jgi:hypothetical protein
MFFLLKFKFGKRCKINKIFLSLKYHFCIFANNIHSIDKMSDIRNLSNMKSIFNNLDLKEFEKYFCTEERCLEFLSNLKWQNGFVCRRCGHASFCKGKTPFSRRCNRCKIEESATAHTLFHKCKFPLMQAFRIVFQVCNTPDISIHKLSEEINLRQMTCWKFKKKIEECKKKRGDVILADKQWFIYHAE